MQPVASHRRFFLVDQSLVPFALNFVLNGAIAWALFRGVESVPFLGRSGIVGDTLITSFLLPFATCLIVTGLIHKRLSSGKLHALAAAPRGGVGAFLTARGRASRGALLGAAAVALLALPTLALLSAAGVDSLARDAFLWFKAGYAGAVAAIAQPAIAWLALASRVVWRSRAEPLAEQLNARGARPRPLTRASGTT